MKVNTAMVLELRKQRSWSQDELATAAGLNLRTIQRIENEGTASLQSLKAIASVFSSRVSQTIRRRWIRRANKVGNSSRWYCLLVSGGVQTA
jgi:transcriptional regulator with XRE-family HTH domain